MIDPIPDRIAVTFNLTANDYARFSAVVSRHQSGQANLYAYIAVFFAAIPVTLLFRSIGAHGLDDPPAVDSIGQLSLAGKRLSAHGCPVGNRPQASGRKPSDFQGCWQRSAGCANWQA
jgi:hypothetical protein